MLWGPTWPLSCSKKMKLKTRILFAALALLSLPILAQNGESSRQKHACRLKLIISTTNSKIRQPDLGSNCPFTTRWFPSTICLETKRVSTKPKKNKSLFSKGKDIFLKPSKSAKTYWHRWKTIRTRIAPTPCTMPKSNFP